MSEKDINRWQELTYIRPEGPWEMGNGGSFDRQEIRPISDEMLAELAHWLKMGYTPWNGRSMPLSAGDRQFMYLLYFSVQGLVARMRQAERRADEAAAAERERCAKLCDGIHARHIAEHGDYIGETYAAECARAIRG